MDTDPRLNELDARAVDALFEGGLHDDATGGGQDERARRVREVVGLLGQLPEEQPADDLTQRTLSFIQQSIDDEQRRRRLDEQVSQLARGPIRSAWSIHLRELAAAAAVVLIGLSVVWPFLKRDAAPDWGGSESLQAGMGSGLIAAPQRELVHTPVPSRPGMHDGGLAMVGDVARVLSPLELRSDQAPAPMMSRRWIDRMYRDRDGNVFVVRWTLIPAHEMEHRQDGGAADSGRLAPDAGPDRTIDRFSETDS